MRQTRRQELDLELKRLTDSIANRADEPPPPRRVALRLREVDQRPVVEVDRTLTKQHTEAGLHSAGLPLRL